jgi:hypothetical protein
MVTAIRLALFCAIVFHAFAAGPFGFEYGMTKEQVTEAVGQSAVEMIASDTFQVTTAPKPYEEFDYYILVISPTRGLLNIAAVGKHIQTTVFGDEIREAFYGVESTVNKRYGDPFQVDDFVRSGSIWTASEDWMMGLVKQERRLFSIWTRVNTNHITTIALSACADSTDAGYFILVYSFEGFREYNAAKKATAGKVF